MVGFFVHNARWIGLVTAALVVAGILAYAPSPGGEVEAGAAQLRDEIQRLRERLSEAESNIEGYESDIHPLQQEKSGLSRELSETERKMQKVGEELEEAKLALELAELEVKQAAEALAREEAELERRIDLLHRRVRAMYELGTVSYLEVLLSATDFADLVRRFQMLTEIVNQDVSIVEAVSEQRDTVEEHKESWLAKEEEAAEWADTVAERKEQLEAQVASYESNLEQLSDREQEYRAAIDEMERRSEEIAQGITEKQEELALEEGIPYLEWPMDEGSFRISSGYGMRYHPILGEQRMHSGVDMAAPTGTVIRSAGDGTVLDVGWMGGYGLTVIVAHTATVSTLYAHNSSTLVNPGDTVSMGQPIARCGATGMATGPHLHFEVRVEGQHQNPTEYLPPR